MINDTVKTISFYPETVVLAIAVASENVVQGKIGVFKL